MIPRTLVPRNVRPVDKDELKKPARRLNTYLDDRTVVPSELSDAPPLDGKTTIPSHLPLDVLVNRTLVPRGMPAKAIEHFEPITEHIPIAVLDSRVVVPAYVEPLAPGEIQVLERPPEMTQELREIVEPDIFTTGDANLLIEPEEKKTAKAELTRAIGSITFHVLLILFLIFAPKLIPAPKEQTIGDNLDTHWMYSPPETPAPPAKPTPKLNVNRETLNRVAPPELKPPAPAPAPEPPKPTPELPDQPRPKPSVALAQPQPQPSASIPQPPAQPRLEPVLPAQPSNRIDLGLNKSSPGKQIEDQMQDAAHGGRPGAVYGGGPPVGGGGQGMGMNNGAEILSDTQGVDFSAYIRRLLATLRRNWEYVMPESARMGDRGIVYTSFSINPDGSVSSPDPALDRTSGKEPLDNAAMAAIHASNPFEPLPKEFHGPYLRLRIIFIYNIPPDQVNLH
jgi:TonB family protein